jgi:hypothetical protein
MMFYRAVEGCVYDLTALVYVVIIAAEGKETGG